jgi:hypothetical protein
MSNFYLDFKNNTDTLTLKFETYDSSISKKWYIALQNILNQELTDKPKIRENDRLYNFNNNTWSEENIIKELTICIDKLNSHSVVITEVPKVGCTPEDTNKLHKFFELMRGRILEPAEYYTNATDNIKFELERFNVLIHRLEYFHKTKNKSNLAPRLVVTFNDNPRFILDKCDFNEFSLDSEFGEVYINYCEVGKSLIDVFVDNDDIVGDKSIIPQKYYSADFGVKFYKSNMSHILPKFWEWFDNKSNYLAALGFRKTDNDLALGTIKVAKLVETISREELIEKISKFNTINSVYIE